MANITSVSPIKYPNIVEGPRTTRSKISPLTLERTYAEHTGGVVGLGILDGNRFISGSSDGSIKTWDKSSVKSLKTQYPHKQNSIWHMQFLSDKVSVAIGWGPTDASNQIRIYNSEDESFHDRMSHRGRITSFALSKDGLLASGSFDWTAKIWEPVLSQLLHHYERSGAIVLCVGFLLDGKTFVCGNSKGEIQFWEMTLTRDDRKPDKVLHSLHPYPIFSLLVMANGNIATGSSDGIVRIWDSAEIPEKALKRELRGQYGHITALAERPDHLLISGSSDGTMILWDTDTGESWLFPKEHTGQIRAIAAFDDNSVLTASFDGTVKLWADEIRFQARL